MDKIKIGIPRSINYYYYGYFLKNFFEELDYEVIISDKTNRQIIDEGMKYANDEMCYAMKIYLGHIAYLKDKCDYILIPRIDNYGTYNQTCTNFLALYDIVNNLFNVKILNYNVDVNNKEDELYALCTLGKKLTKNRFDIIRAYEYTKEKEKTYLKKESIINYNHLLVDKIKILLVGHSYIVYDNYIGKPIIKMLEKLGVQIIYCDKFDRNLLNSLSKNYSENLYWKFNRENTGAISLVQNKVDGIIFLSSFPCGPDSLINELIMRKLNKPYLNLIVDDMDSLTGMETRIESFVDILNEKSRI